MTTYVLRRVLLMVPTLFVIATLTFVLMRMAPGGPFMSEKEIPAKAKAELLQRYGLDRPLHEQYAAFLGNVVRLDFGPSYKYPDRQVRDIILQGFSVSAELGAWALALALLIGVPVDTIAAVRQNQAADHAAMTLALAGVSVPNFVLGPAFVLAFALTLLWLPAGLWTGPASRVMPVLALSVSYVAYIARLTRAGMLEVLRQDYIRTARAKGLGERTVILKHALRATLTPIITIFGIDLGLLLGGAVLTESTFSLHGLGLFTIEAINNQDFPEVMGVVMLASFFIVIANMVVDILYAVVDPRVRH